MKNSYNKDEVKIEGNDSPAEQRAIKNENTAREQEKLPMRTQY